MNFWKFLLFNILIISSASASHIHKESYYQVQWCNKEGGVTEYVLSDKARVDCLTKDYAVEFDFASKWAESIGQSLYYAKMTNKKPAIVLIMEANSDEIYYKRAKKVADEYDIKLYTMNNAYAEAQEEDLISYLLGYIKGIIKQFLIDLVDKIC